MVPMHRPTKREDQTVMNRGGPRAGKAVPSHCGRCTSARTGTPSCSAAGGATVGCTWGGGACSCRHKEQSSPCGPRACGRDASSSPAWPTTTNLTAPEAPQTNSSDWGWISGAAPAIPTTQRNHARTRRAISGEERRRCIGLGLSPQFQTLRYSFAIFYIATFVVNKAQATQKTSTQRCSPATAGRTAAVHNRGCRTRVDSGSAYSSCSSATRDWAAASTTALPFSAVAAAALPTAPSGW